MSENLRTFSAAEKLAIMNETKNLGVHKPSASTIFLIPCFENGGINLTKAVSVG